ncbi:MAG: HEAT repeat domain-containing protein [Sedimentisphaerales bacterium]
MKKLILVTNLMLCLSFGSPALANNIETLIKELGHKSKAKDASKSLAEIGKPTVPALIQALEGKNKYQKRYAARAIREMGQTGSDAIPALEKLLKDRDTQTREYAVEALGNMLLQAEHVLPMLKKATKDKNKDVAEKANRSIQKIQTALTDEKCLADIIKNRLNTTGKRCTSLVLEEESPNQYKGVAEFEDGLKTQVVVKVSGSKVQYSFGRLVANDKETKDFSQEHSPQKEAEIQDEKTTSDPNCTDFRVFGVSLNASLQQVVNELENNEIPIYDGLITMDSFDRNVKFEIDKTYDKRWNTPSHQKEKALKLLDEKKIKSFYVKYKGKEYAADPKSLECLLKKPGIYPVLEDYYDIYNSQFMLECRPLPLHMTSQGISGMLIMFASIGQSEPKSFLICFDTSSPMGVLDNLEKKYGIPTMYYTDTIRPLVNEGYRDILAKRIDVKRRSFQHHERRPEGPLYPELSEALIVHSLPFMLKGASFSYVVEWNCNDTKILLLTMTSDRISENEGLLAYVHWPKIRQLAGMYKKVYQASEKAKVKIVEKGRRGF